MKPQVIPPAAWPERLAPVLDDMDGQPLNVHGLMASHPELLGAWWNFRNHSVSGGALGRRWGELVILRVAVLTRSWYEWASHVVRGQQAGLSLDEIERVKQGSGAVGWSDAESALLQAVDELLVEQRIVPATLLRLEAHLDARQLLDLVAITGMYFTLAGMIRSFGLELDERYARELPEGMDEASFLASLAAG